MTIDNTETTDEFYDAKGNRLTQFAHETELKPLSSVAVTNEFNETLDDLLKVVYKESED